MGTVHPSPLRTVRQRFQQNPASAANANMLKVKFALIKDARFYHACSQVGGRCVTDTKGYTLTVWLLMNSVIISVFDVP